MTSDDSQFVHPGRLVAVNYIRQEMIDDRSAAGASAPALRTSFHLMYLLYPQYVSTHFQVDLLVDISSALIAHLWFRKYEPENIGSCLLQITLFAIARIVVTLPSPWVHGFVHLGLFLSFLLSSIVLYRISPLHPLAKHPGPLICKISKIRVAWVSSKGKLHLYYEALHKKYGPIVRVSPNELSVADAKLIPSILGQQGMPKGPLWDGRAFVPNKFRKSNYGLINVRDYNIHAQLRKPWNRAFSPAALHDYEESLIARGTELLENLRAICDKATDGISHTDIAQSISYWSFDFMGDMAFGESFGLMREGDKDGYLRGMEKALKLLAVTQTIPWTMSTIRSISSWNKDLGTFSRFTVQLTQKRISTITEKKDLFYHLAASMGIDGDAPPLPVLVSNVALAIIAGSDSTSSVLSGIMYYLLKHPKYLRRLQEELDLTFPPSENAVVQIDKLASLELLNATIHEVLRLQPPLLTSLQRAPAKNSGGKLIGDMFITEGTAVNVPPYVLHRDSRYFSPKPDEFWPERWYTQSDKIILDRSAYIPFSYGPANCAGKTLAMSELRYITAILVHSFDFWFEDGYDPAQWERDLLDQFVIIKGKLPVKMKRRKP